MSKSTDKALTWLNCVALACVIAVLFVEGAKDGNWLAYMAVMFGINATIAYARLAYLGGNHEQP